MPQEAHYSVEQSNYTPPLEEVEYSRQQSIGFTPKHQYSESLTTTQSCTIERTSNRENMIILSVDDDIVNQEVIKTALSDRYEIHVAMNGFEALEFFSSSSRLPDLVLLDIMMPGMDGFTVLKEIREGKNISQTKLPIIMLSAIEPIDQSVIKSLKSGMQALFLFKLTHP